MARRLVLASASTARLTTMRSAGLNPQVIPSGADEDGTEALDPRQAVLVLARRKAEAVAAAMAPSGPAEAALIVGCDSMLEIDGRVWGKPTSRADVAARWQQMRGGQGLLHTGHCIIDGATGAQASGTDTAVVRFGRPTEREIEAYAASDEALAVAGPFTIEGLAAPWIDSIDGNAGTVMGVSLPMLRSLLHELQVEIIDLWS